MKKIDIEQTLDALRIQMHSRNENEDPFVQLQGRGNEGELAMMRWIFSEYNNGTDIEDIRMAAVGISVNIQANICRAIGQGVMNETRDTRKATDAQIAATIQSIEDYADYMSASIKVQSGDQSELIEKIHTGAIRHKDVGDA